MSGRGHPAGGDLHRNADGATVCFLVSHTHWDREWYRTFQQFRARLVDTVDRALTLLDNDSGYCFVLDGQSIIVVDYLAIRPQQRPTLQKHCLQGRLAVGPWYVQPDSLLPVGETHVRNLLLGIAHARMAGRSSRVAYTPDSFGHPAQLPQIFAGFGLKLFVYWRGNGDEIDTLPSTYQWVAPDGSTVLAHHLAEGYFNAAELPSDPEKAASLLAPVVSRLRERNPQQPALLMHGIDHAFPQPHTQAVADALSQTIRTRVVRGTLDDFAATLKPPRASYRGELRGARVANLLPGVWSSRMHLKAENRHCESLLLQWMEPWAALALALVGQDERPALRLAWATMLENQAHDSIGGCSIDAVHEQMLDRFRLVREVAYETTRRILERLAGMDGSRQTPWTQPWSVYVFNPSPFPRTDLVRLPLDPHPWFGLQGDEVKTLAVHPWITAAAVPQGFTVNGVPVRIVEDSEAPRVRLRLEQQPLAIEFLARDVPALGCTRVVLRAHEQPVEDIVDDGDEIANEFLRVKADPSGTFDVDFLVPQVRYQKLGNWEDLGDRGDTYDFDPVPGTPVLRTVGFRRTRHASGIETLRIERLLELPRKLAPSREARSQETVLLPLVLELRLAPRLTRLLIDVWLENTACDHRLRLLFPTGQPAATCFAATTFDIARRPTEIRAQPHWVHPPTRTFPHHGFVHANGLTVTAPGLPEAEVTPEGTIALTLLRAVGWLSLPGLHTRPDLAGPTIPTPNAQCLGPFRTRLALSYGLDCQTVTELSAGLWPVVGGDQPLLEPQHSLLAIEPRDVVLSALLPAPRRHRLWLRLLNPWEHTVDAAVRFGFPVAGVQSLRLDGSRNRQAFRFEQRTLTCSLKPHQLRSFGLDLAAPRNSKISF